MPRLRGADAGFLYMESAAQPVVTTQCAAIAPRTPDAGPFTRAWLHDRFAARLDRLPSLRWRLAPTPYGLHHPCFVDDPDFDLDHHLFHVVVTGTDGLDRFVASQTTTPLDLERPLWRCTLVDDLAAGRQVLVFAEQHALLDGIALMNTMRGILDGDADEPPAPFRPPPLPPRGRLLADALRHQAAQWRRMPALVRDTRAGVAALEDYDRTSPVAVPKALQDVPVTPFNDARGRRRVSRRTTTPVDDLKQIRAVAGCTVNDVALAVVAGALRDHLLARGALPAAPLVANVPVAADNDVERRWGNVFANVLTTLATDVDDPWDRLEAIARMTPVAKARLDAGGNQTVARWLDYAFPAAARPVFRAVTRYRMRHPERLEANVLVSNVRASARRWESRDAVVEAFWCYGPPTNLLGLNISLVSYGDTSTWTIQAHAEALDDPDELVAGIHRSVRALLAAAEHRATVAVGAP